MSRRTRVVRDPRPPRRWRASALVTTTLIALAGCGSAPRPATSASAGATHLPVTPTIATATPTPTPSPSPSLRQTPVKVAIFGDSQGTALYHTRPRSVSKYLTLSDQSISACGILRGQVVSRSGERFNLIGACPNWLNEWRRDAQRVKPDIALIVIGAWDVFDLKTNDGTVVFGTTAWDAAFLTTLRSGLDAIRESGAQIALAELPCYRPRKSNPRPPGWWPERGDDDRIRHVNELLRQTTDGRHVFTVRPAAAFCDDKSVSSNRTYRYDGVHYLQPGAKVYFDAIIPQLLALP